MTSEKFVGIDVSKSWLDVQVHEDGQAWKVENDLDGFAKLIVRMKMVGPALIVFEATGGYERHCVKALSEAGLAVAVVNPTRVRRFAEALGVLAKTDKIDARVIAHYASVVRPPAKSRQTPLEEQLVAYVERRRQLMVEITGEKNRLSTSPDMMRADIEEHIAWIDEHVKKLDAQIQTCIAQKAEWKERAEIIDSVPGVGPVTASTLVAEMPELGLLNRQEIAALEVSHLSIKIAALRKANVRPLAGERGYDEPCSWRPSRQSGVIQSFDASMSRCENEERRRKSL